MTDCSDGSDEEGCYKTNNTQHCELHEFACNTLECIPSVSKKVHFNSDVHVQNIFCRFVFLRVKMIQRNTNMLMERVNNVN